MSAHPHRVGFTGTRTGMTDAQKATFRRVIGRLEHNLSQIERDVDLGSTLCASSWCSLRKLDSVEDIDRLI